MASKDPANPTLDNRKRELAASLIAMSIHSRPIPLFTIKHTDYKGLGLIANIDIPAGTRILAESALVVMPQKLILNPLKASYFILKALSKLPLHSQHDFRRLHRNNDLPSDTALYDIFLVNCADRNDGAEAAVYKTFSRINHSCAPNCEQGFDPRIDKQVVYALVDIKKGEEITVSYRNVLEPSTRRLPNLKRHYDFVCQCSVCSLSPEEIAKRDKKLINLDKLTEYYNTESDKLDLKKKLNILRRKHELMVDLDIKTSTIAQPLFEAMRLCAPEQGCRASVFGLRAHKEYVRCCGKDSVDVKDIEEAVLDPVKDWLGALRWDGETILGMRKAEFEDWLWGDSEFV